MHSSDSVLRNCTTTTAGHKDRFGTSKAVSAKSAQRSMEDRGKCFQEEHKTNQNLSLYSRKKLQLQTAAIIPKDEGVKMEVSGDSKQEMRLSSSIQSSKTVCPHQDRECSLVGDEDYLKQHTARCPERSWRCKYCDFTSTRGLSLKEHIPKCPRYPIGCPNQCSLSTLIIRCDLEKHLGQCPFQLVACEFSDAGCDVKVARKDLKHHMEVAQQRHLLCAKLLNIKLTRETLQSKRDKENAMAEKDEVVIEKDQQIIERSKKLFTVQTSVEKQAISITTVTGSIDRLLMHSTCHKLVLQEFTECQRKSDSGDWFSEPFYSRPSGYKLRLNILTNGVSDVRNTHLSVQLHILQGDFDSKLVWPVTFVITLRLLCQHDENISHEKTCICSFVSPSVSSSVLFLSSLLMFKEFILLEMINRNTSRFLKDNCLKFYLFIHVM